MTELSNPTPIKPPRNQWWDVWDQFKTHKGAMIGAVFFILMVLGVTLGPWLWSIGPTFIDIRVLTKSIL